MTHESQRAELEDLLKRMKALHEAAQGVDPDFRSRPLHDHYTKIRTDISETLGYLDAHCR